MVASVNGNSLAALTARENAQNQRPASSQLPDRGQGDSGGHGEAVVYAGSSGAPSLSAVLSVQDSLNRAAAISDVGLSAGRTISDLLKLARDKAAAAQGASPDGKSALNDEFQQLLQTINQIARSASFQGVKVIDGSASADLQFKTDVSGEGQQLTITPQDFTAGGPTLGLAGADLLGSSDDLAAVLQRLDAAGGALDGGLADLGAQADQIQTHLGVIGQLQGALASRTSPDLDAEGARLQALQVQQALAGQGGGLANQAPQALLALFRS